MSTTVKLTRPIQAHGATVSELTLRPPKGRDIAACGIPRSVAKRGTTLSMEIDTASVHAYISALGNIPPSSVDQIDAADWMGVQEAVLDFFVPGRAAPDDGAPSASPAPGTPDPKPGIRIPFQDESTT